MFDALNKALTDPDRLALLELVNLVDTPIDESFDRVTRLASTILNVPICLVTLVEPDRQFFKSQFGLPEPLATERVTPISYSFCKHVIASGEVLAIEDTRDHPVVGDNPAIYEHNAVSYLGIPLTIADNLHLGSLCVIDHEPRNWSEQDIETLRVLTESLISEIRLRLEAKNKEHVIDQLHVKNAELEAFAHTVSHNLKNPLSAIIGWSSVSSQYADKMSPDDLQEAIEKMGELAFHTNDIINALLLLAGINREGEVRFKKLNMFNIIDDALSRLQNQITRHNATIYLPQASEFPKAYGYRQWIEEVWINYISNALKYGGDPPLIQFGAEKEPHGFIRYWIKDNGRGLSPEEVEKIFVPFNRLPKTANKVEGHGLGLSIVLQIIEKLGGEVGVTSEVNAGSTFSFTLPAKPPSIG